MNERCPKTAMASPYVEGTLDHRQAASFERHAARCDVCADAIDQLLAPTADNLRQTLVSEPVPVAVQAKLEGVTRKRTRWLPLTLAAAAVAAVFIVTRSPELPSIPISGAFVMRGETIGSHNLRRGALIKTAGPTRLMMGGLTIVSNSSFNQFELTLDGDTWEFRNPSSSLTFVHVGTPTKYRAIVGDKRYTPSGTRFRLAADGTLDVFEKSVSVRGSMSTTLVKAGQSFGGSSTKTVEDDPSRFVDQRPVLPPVVAQWLPAVAVDFESGMTVATARFVKQQVSSEEPGGYARVALALARDYDLSGSETALGLALREDSGLSPLSEGDLRLLFADHLAFGSERGARIIATVCQGRSLALSDSWQALLSSGSIRERIDAAQLALNESEGETAVAAAAILVRESVNASVDRAERGYDYDALRKVAHTLPALLEKEGAQLSLRARATLLAQLAEAQRYLPETELLSLKTLRASVQLWRKPSRVVNLCARLAELSKPTIEDRSLLLSAFIAEPSFAAAARVLTFLRDTANSQERVQAVSDFAEWIAASYKCVANAQAIAAEHLMDIEPAKAARLFQNMRDLVEGDWSRLEPQHVDAYARYQWRSSRGAKDAEQIALDCGLKVGGLFATSSLPFLEEAGMFDAALEVVEATALPILQKSLSRARILRKAGHNSEAVAEYLTFLKVRGTPQVLEMDDFDARLCLGELLWSTDLNQSRGLALWVLSQDMNGIRRGWREIRRFDLGFRARSEWLLGRRQRAVALQRAFLEHWTSSPIKQIESARLKSWLRSTGS